MTPSEPGAMPGTERRDPDTGELLCPMCGQHVAILHGDEGTQAYVGRERMVAEAEAARASDDRLARELYAAVIQLRNPLGPRGEQATGFENAVGLVLDIFNRRGVADRAVEPVGLDVERLAKALCWSRPPQDPLPDDVRFVDDECRALAKRTAAEYARLGEAS